MNEFTSSPEKLMYEGEIDLELQGISIGKAKVKVYEGSPTYGAARELNPTFLIVKAIYNEKEYEITSNEGGIEEALSEMKRHIQESLQKGR